VGVYLYVKYFRVFLKLFVCKRYYVKTSRRVLTYCTKVSARLLKKILPY